MPEAEDPHVTEVCFRHADRPAVERCELCGRPVCGLCLWYADSGERLCPEHGAAWQAQGRPVHPPERYARGMVEPGARAAASAGAPGAPYQGTSADVGALIAAVAGVLALASCAGFGWLVPLVALLAGAAAWLQSGRAVDPRRTRWLAGVGVAGGGVLVLVVAAMIFAIAACVILGMAANFSGGPGPRPTP